MIRPIHKNKEPVLNQRAVPCVAILDTPELIKENNSLTGAIATPIQDIKEKDYSGIPWPPYILELIQDLKDTAENIADNCLGLASNQIWVPENYGQPAGDPPPAVFVMRWPEATKTRQWDWKAFLNPDVKPTGKTLKKVESCLSFPNKEKRVNRGKNIMFRWQPEEEYIIYTLHLREAQGQFAQIAQHEFDHLHGKHV